MTVQELINKLEAINKDLDVFIAIDHMNINYVRLTGHQPTVTGANVQKVNGFEAVLIN